MNQSDLSTYVAKVTADAKVFCKLPFAARDSFDVAIIAIQTLPRNFLYASLRLQTDPEILRAGDAYALAGKTPNFMFTDHAFNRLSPGALQFVPPWHRAP